VLRLGADWREAAGTALEAVYNPGTGAVTARRSAGGRNGDFGLYAEDDWTLGPLVLTAGIRADRWSIAAGLNREFDAAGALTQTASPARAGWSVTGRGGAVLRLSGAVALRASAYRGLRQPSLNELYRSFTLTAPAPGGGTATTRTLANPALSNERLEGFEAGLDLTPAPGVTFSATLFDNRLRDAVANVTVSTIVTPNGVTVTRQRRNVEAIRARGVELGAGLKAGNFGLDLSWALTDATVRASGPAAQLNGLRPAQTPKVAASATLAWTPRPGWRAALTVRHVGAQYEDDLQTDVLPAATTLDAYAQVPLRRGLTLVLRAENLTDEAVVTRNQGGSIDLGAPRTLWAGLRFGGD